MTCILRMHAWIHTASYEYVQGVIEILQSFMGDQILEPYPLSTHEKNNDLSLSIVANVSTLKNLGIFK